MLGRIDRLAELGTTIITLSGGEPTLHPDPQRTGSLTVAAR
jgi:MoaA/NifB/PqqE/SkfB family radical SAM enzyme